MASEDIEPVERDVVREVHARIGEQLFENIPEGENRRPAIESNLTNEVAGHLSSRRCSPLEHRHFYAHDSQIERSRKAPDACAHDGYSLSLRHDRQFILTYLLDKQRLHY
jgi:hypothetical protein